MILIIMSMHQRRYTYPMALIVWQKPNLLLLDEPTNHLDLDMRQA